MAARAVTRLYDEKLRDSGLRATQVSVLVAIAVDEVMSIAALAKFMGMDRSTLTRNLRPLERDGLVKLGSEGWRRSRTVEALFAGNVAGDFEGQTVGGVEVEGFVTVKNGTSLCGTSTALSANSHPLFK